jgi:dGTPase
MSSSERPDLASYAAKSHFSRGRRYKEDFKDQRPAFERDRDRIIHSSAFRRLEYKTQVFVNHEGDYYRTRLTHSLEVAQIARGIARGLHLNEDLAESLALAHDLGHTPFGHSGEKVLNQLMHNKGGFEHNLQSLRVDPVTIPPMLHWKTTSLIRYRRLKHRLSILPMRLPTTTMTLMMPLKPLLSLSMI